MNSVEDLDINPKIKTSLKKVGLTSFGQILTLSIQDIQRLTKLSQGEVTGIKTAIALQVMPQPSLTAFDIQKLTDKCPDRLKIGKLSTGCKQIDEALRGGILTRGITEIAGESASGAAYICTEDVFPSKRLGQMIGYFSQRTDIHKKIAFGDNIFIEHVADLESLNACIHQKLPHLLSSGGVKLVIVDSVAAVFRCDYELKDMYKRSKHMASLAASLQKLSSKYCLPVVCVNQVTDSMQTLHRRQIPALGLAWSNQITCRLSLARTSHELDLPRNILNGVVIGGFPTSIRTLEVTFAPNLPNLELVYVIDQEGIKTVS
ncbi:DNA repair protein XRCC3-like isoform X3 [Ostrea edulis]|uniref:DNA repair protein XRCC3-like isoform X3 n=1 Tax=Ostrea edulis TaxID=37623 RepID=UPI0024AED65B|nr:DNA repair protein XRCC3-like isoform X3 [Ostrea edulis]